jgi:hypothetical protein
MASRFETHDRLPEPGGPGHTPTTTNAFWSLRNENRVSASFCDPL